MREELKGRKVLVVGLGKSGLAAVDLLLECGAKVSATDLRSRQALGPIVRKMKQRGVALALGRHPTELFLESSLVVMSPGVPRSLEPIQAAREAGGEIITELELGYRCIDFPVVAVTGTNGKSTTTTFIGHLLRGAGRRAFVGGNLGTPLSRAFDKDHDVGVVEVSSFQLEWSPSLRPEVAVLLNVSADHLDRYRDFDEYAETKGLLFSNQREIDFAIANEGDPLTVRLASLGSGRLYTFGHGTTVKRGMRYHHGALWFGEEDTWLRVPLNGFKPRGRHNIENLMAAFLAASLIGVQTGKLVDLVPQLEGLPHRLEFVRELDDVRYYNDSKATNVTSVLCSLRDFRESVVLLMGGRDKGSSYAPLVPVIGERARVVIVMGEARERIRKALEGAVDVQEVDDLEAGVQLARQVARPGDSVVLSPACASFDQFPNYEVRGETFRQHVWALDETNEERGQ